MHVGEASKHVEQLLGQLEDEDELIRENGAYLLGELGGEARALMENTLKNGKTLSEINPLTAKAVRDKVVKHLIRTLFDKDGWVRGNAADALGKIGDRSAVAPLIAALQDDENIVRYGAAEALGEIGDQDALDAVIGALRDEDWSVRASAAEALGKIGMLKALEALTQACGDKNRDVQAKAAEALASISGGATGAARQMAAGSRRVNKSKAVSRS